MVLSFSPFNYSSDPEQDLITFPVVFYVLIVFQKLFAVIGPPLTEGRTLTGKHENNSESLEHQING